MICVSSWKHVFCMCILPFSGSHGDRSPAINISYLSHFSRYSRDVPEYFIVCVTAELVFAFRSGSKTWFSERLVETSVSQTLHFDESAPTPWKQTQSSGFEPSSPRMCTQHSEESITAAATQCLQKMISGEILRLDPLFVLHDVPVQLHLLHLLHQPQHAAFEVGLEADVVLQDQRLVHLHVHDLTGRRDISSV